MLFVLLQLEYIMMIDTHTAKAMQWLLGESTELKVVSIQSLPN
jgi:hypothetical protein